LLLVEVQKSSRATIWSSFSNSRLCFFPNGGLVSTNEYSLFHGAATQVGDSPSSGQLYSPHTASDLKTKRPGPTKAAVCNNSVKTMRPRQHAKSEEFSPRGAARAARAAGACGRGGDEGAPDAQRAAVERRFRWVVPTRR
jgi:hypothetical protein